MALLESFLRSQLDGATNGKGRPVQEYRLRVETLQNGVLALQLFPIGFESEVLVLGVEHAAPLGPEALAQLIVDKAAAAAKYDKDVQDANTARLAQETAAAAEAEELVAADVATRQAKLGGKDPAAPAGGGK
jgi:hypothetical protein